MRKININKTKKNNKKINENKYKNESRRKNECLYDFFSSDEDK